MPTESTRQGWEERLREAATHVETDVKRMVTYLNDEVLPDVRRNGSAALRAAATELQRLAERIDQANREPTSKPKD